MMGKKRLRNQPASGGKHITQPQDSSSGSSQNLKPLFSFEHLRHGYCISDCDNDEKAALANKLREMSQLTWAQIRSAPRHGQGCEIIDRSSIRDGIPSHITEDVPILALRFCGMKPMVGYREDRTFAVVWLDCKFSLYDHS